ncbi:MAG TPA: hypothetical protein PLD56_00480 [Chitinophagales bacterium]|nr:hypothetical protein [Chitinophagales bacterium]
MKNFNFKKFKNWIDNADYEQLLYKWRYSIVGEQFFLSEIGNYYKSVMLEKKKSFIPKKIISVNKKVRCCL